MKKYVQLVFIILQIFSVNIFAEDLLFHFPQSKETVSDTLKGKTSLQRDTSVQRIKREIILPIRRPSLQEDHLPNFIFSKEKLSSIDYRSSADFFTNMPFGFVRDFGSAGQPNETLIYANGFGNVSFLSDGVPITNRISNSLDLNLLQSESVGSVEIIPLARGFLFGNFSNSASVNFIAREPDFRKPFSRLKYYQGGSGEGLLDAIFNITPVNKLSTYFEISNHSKNPTYTNTDYSNWSGTARLRYLLSRTVNLTASYRYAKSVIQLNGGVDADSVNTAYTPAQFNRVLYDNLLAPVRFSNRYQKVMVNDFRLGLLSNIFDNATTDLSLYYQSTLTEFRQNEYAQLDTTKVKNIVDDNFHKTVGINLHQKLKLGSINISSITNAERSTFSTPLLSREIVKSSFSESIIADISLFDNLFTPSVYVRYLNYSDKSYIGIGADASFRLNNLFKIYAGISSFQRPYSIWEERFALQNALSEKQNNHSAELSLIYESGAALITINYFLQSKKNSLLSSSFINFSGETETLFFAADELNLNGLNLKLDFKLWKFLFNSNSSFYFASQSKRNFKLPDYTSTGGVYYVDTLFSSNLHLKTGITYYSVGSRDYISYDFERSVTSYYNFGRSLPAPDIINPSISPTFQIDFFLAGRIQNSATIYFVFENLLDSKYFIVPYYPKQARGIRFGVAWELLD